MLKVATAVLPVPASKVHVEFVKIFTVKVPVAELVNEPVIEGELLLDGEAGLVPVTVTAEIVWLARADSEKPGNGRKPSTRTGTRSATRARLSRDSRIPT